MGGRSPDRCAAVYSCRLGLVFVARVSGARGLAPAMLTAPPNKSPPDPSPTRLPLLFSAMDLGGGCSRRGRYGGGGDLVVDFAPPAPPTQRRVLHRRCGAMEDLYRSWSPCISDGGGDQKMARTGLGWRLQACRSGQAKHHLGSEGSRCLAWPTSHSDKLPAGNDGAFLRTMKPNDGEGASPTCGGSPAVAVAAAETSGAYGCAVQEPLRGLLQLSLFWGGFCKRSVPAVLLVCSGDRKSVV